MDAGPGEVLVIGYDALRLLRDADVAPLRPAQPLAPEPARSLG